MTDDYCEKDVVSSPFTVSGPLTITFNANDGTDEPATKTQTVTYNVAATLDANTFTRTGYVFQGWATTAGGAKVHNDGASVTFTESTVLYAVWEVNSHSVTFTLSPTGATVTVNSSSTSPQTVEYGSTVTVVVTPAEHYTLYSIEVSNGASVTIKNNTGTFTMPDENVTVTVTMTEEPQYTVNWYVNGSATQEEKYAGETLVGITAPDGDAVCDGKAFVGWTATADYSNETTAPADLFTDPTTKTMPSGGTSYYAVFAEAFGTTTIDPNTWIRITDTNQLTDGATVMLVQYYSDQAINNTPSATSCVANAEITNTNTALRWTAVQSGTKWKFKTSANKYLSTSATDNNTTLELDATYDEWTISADNGGGTGSNNTYTNTNCFRLNNGSDLEYYNNTFKLYAWSLKYSSAYPFYIYIQKTTGTITYSNYSTSCVECTYKVTLTKGGESHGTFMLDKANGEHNNCTSDFVVTVSGITPDAGYYCTGVTVTGEHVTVSGPDGSGNYTVTYTQGYSITSTITANFAAIPPRTFTFVPGTGNCATTTMSEGVWNTGVTLPTATANSGCDPEYVFAGWATAFVSETDVRPTLYKAGETYNGSDLTLYAVYAQTTGGSGTGFTLSYTYNDVTYYASGRTGTNKYMDASTDVAEASRFTLVTSNDKQFLCWHGTEDTYIYTGTSNNTNLSFTTNIASAANGWNVTETDATLKLQSNGNSRYFMFNTNQKDRFAAYAVEGELTKGSSGTTIYNSNPSCVCTSVDIIYNANGGILAEGCEDVTGGDCERNWKLCDAPMREGYMFTGWKDQAGNLYSAGATITELKISLTLTAQWIPAPYTVLFDAGTGTSIESLTETSRGDGIILPKAEPSAACADDWTFIGWSETKLSGELNTTATIIGVAGIEYIPAANNTTLYAVYSMIDTDGADSDYTRIVEPTPAEGDYVIVLAQSDESFGKLTYGTLNKGRLTYTEDYTELPNKITSPAATQIWHLTYDADDYAYLYNANAGAYLASSGYNVDYNANGGSAFLFTRDPGTYGDYKCLNNTASSSDSYYLGANKDANANYIRYYSSSALVSLYSVTLYQGSAGTRYYSTVPECTPCTDPEWSFELGTNVVKSKGSAPFTNNVTKGHVSEGTVTYSSTNEAVATVDNTGLVTLVGTGTTTITLRLTRAMPYCAAVMQYELEVKEPSIDIVGVTADGEIIVEHDLEGTITIDLSEGHAISTGTAANDIFFSKYFEAASNMKLFAIFNGTGHEVDLSNIRVRCNCTTAGTSVWPTKTGDLGYVELNNISRLREQYPKLKIPSGTELIFWSNNKGTKTNSTYNTELRDCIEIVIGDMTYHYSDLEVGEVPNWYCLGDYTTYNKKDADDNNQFIFNGDDSMIMERYDESTGTWVAIDLFGAGTSEAPASTEGLVEQITTEYEINGETQALNDGTGFHAECEGVNIPLSTNRYALRRKNSVLDGLTAVASNTTSFATLCSEWDGTPIGGAYESYCISGEMFSDIGEYDYAENYIEWQEISTGDYQTDENGDGTVTITFTNGEDLDDRACDLLKIEVRDETDLTKVLATTEYKIPIVVKAGEVMTSDELFSDKSAKCATCDVAIMGSATLTKAADGEGDNPTVRDIYVYGGGNLVIPEGTHYNAHDLILRTEVGENNNMNVPNVQVSGSLTNQYGGAIRMQTRIGTSRFYQFAVPYVVRLEDVTFSDGTPAVYGEDFMIRYYDGEQRAANQGTASNWRNYEGTELYPGVGYTLAVAKKTGHTERELIFPMAGASLVDGEPLTKATTIHAWGDNTTRANHRGWNFLSNPYLTTYGQNHLNEDAGGMLTTGRLVPDPEHPGWLVNDEGTIPYVTIINATRTDYSQELVSNQELPPFTTFFIQAGDDSHNSGAEFSLTFDRDNRKASAPAYVRAEQKPSVARFGVLLTGNNAKDNCGMVIGENYSAAYDMQADLSKEFGSAYSLKLYTLQEDQMRLAFQATHPDSLHKVVPVGVRLPATAEYTFSIDRRYNLGAFEHIWLNDNIEGKYVDLLEDTYLFEGTKSQIDNRFSLFIEMRKDTPTSTENLLNGIYAVGRDGSLMLTGLPDEADIYIYDMAGRMIQTLRTSGQASVVCPVVSGVYQIRVLSKGAKVLLRTIVY